MKKQYRVYGRVYVGVSMLVEAESEDDAIAVATVDFDGLTNYCGNGGTNQLVGVHNSDISLEALDDEPEFDVAEEMEE